MTRGLDHVVHVVRDLAAAAAVYERLGFQVGAENVHPWGTRNRLVQLPRFYLELLWIPEAAKLPAPSPRFYSFAAFNREFLQACGEGLSFLVLQSSDPQAEAAEFDKAGFGGFEVLDFARKGKHPDGTETEVAFSLAFARDPASPHAGFFTCLQKTPERIWFAELQRHKNGAQAISAAAILAGSAGTKRGRPAASTSVGTVMMTALADSSPRGVSMRSPSEVARTSRAPLKASRKM